LILLVNQFSLLKENQWIKIPFHFVPGTKTVRIWWPVQIPSLKNDYEARQHMGGFGLSGNIPLLPIRALSGGLKARLVFAEVMFHQPRSAPKHNREWETIVGW